MFVQVTCNFLSLPNGMFEDEDSSWKKVEYFTFSYTVFLKEGYKL